MDERLKHYCPMCKGPLVWQATPVPVVPDGHKFGHSLYPEVREEVHGDKLVLPMRCPRCVINISVRVDPKIFEDGVDDEE